MSDDMRGEVLAAMLRVSLEAPAALDPLVRKIVEIVTTCPRSMWTDLIKREFTRNSGYADERARNMAMWVLDLIVINADGNPIRGLELPGELP